jgi:GxxExxY protein
MELAKAGIPHTRQQKLPVIYKGEPVNMDLRADIVVEDVLILEVKSIQQILPIHEAQLLTYLKISRVPTGLLLNFNETVLKNGIRRRTIA